MGTIKGMHEQLPDMANDVLKKQLLNKLNPELKQKLFDCGGDITVDLKKGTYTVAADSDELEQAIMSDLRSKK